MKNWRSPTPDVRITRKRGGSHARYLFDLLRELAMRDLKLRYKRSLLGLAWSLLNPLVQFLVLYFVFSRVLRVGYQDFPSFLFCGLLSWSWFQSSVSAGTVAITDNYDLIQRPGFPLLILPVVRVVADLLHFLIALPILILFVTVNRHQLNVTLAILPLVIAIQFSLTLGIVYVLATLQVKLRDTQYLAGIALLLLFYLTPIFYGVSQVPTRVAWAFQLNPMLHVIQAYRAILLNGRVPDIASLLSVFALAAVLLSAGSCAFRQASWHFAEEV